MTQIVAAPVGAASGTWVGAVRADELAEGDAMRFVHEGVCIAVYNVGGNFYATSGICTHEHAFLSEGYIEGHTIECPLHQALFDIRTGAVLSPPATVPLKTYEVHVEDGQVVVRVSE